jgi:hypothetical protein
MDEQGRKDARQMLAGITQPITVDTNGRIIDLATPLTNPPAVIDDNAAIGLDARLPLKRIYLPDTIPARIKQSFIDGEGVILTYGLGLAVLGINIAINFWYWTITTVHTIIANFAIIVADCAMVILVIITVLYLLGGGGKQEIWAKGCAKSGFPGRVRVG